MISLNEFKNNLADVARPNRFLVKIYPSEMVNLGTFRTSDLSFLAAKATIPSRAQGKIPMKFHGMEYNLIGDMSKQDLQVVFLNDYEWASRNFFENWMEAMQNTWDQNEKTDSVTFNNTSKIVVQQLGRTEYNDILSEYAFYDIFPIEVSQIELDHNQFDSYEMYQVTFSYSYWENIGVIV